MASITAILSFLLMACTTIAQMVPMDPGCSVSSRKPMITLTYTEFMAPQIAPTSTVYQAIVTTYYHIVFCGRGTPTATVTNVQANPAANGPFTAKTTVSVLTITAVDCMPSDVVVTRREIRGFDHVKRSVTKQAVTTTATSLRSKYPQINPLNAVPIPPGFKEGRSLQKLKAAIHLKAKRQAIPTTLSLEAAALVEQLQTAQYALELCNSDFNLTEICTELRDPAAIMPLSKVGVSASQAGDIVCFASKYGIDLNTTNSVLLGDLAAAVYGLELGDNFTTTTNTTKLCNNINLTAAPYLGIDAGAINNFICGGPSTTVTTTALATQTIIVFPGSPTVTFTPSGIGASGGFPLSSGVSSSGVFPLPSGVGTGGPNGWPNGTFPSATAGGSIMSGAAVSGAPAATGAGNPWSNSIGIDSLGIEFQPTASEGPQGNALKTPVPPDSPQYYPANTLQTTTTAAWGGYA